MFECSLDFVCYFSFALIYFVRAHRSKLLSLHNGKCSAVGIQRGAFVARFGVDANRVRAAAQDGCKVVDDLVSAGTLIPGNRVRLGGFILDVTSIHVEFDSRGIAVRNGKNRQVGSNTFKINRGSIGNGHERISVEDGGIHKA